MKKFLKFSGICAFLLALVAFILMMATPAVMYKGDDVIAKGIVAWNQKYVDEESKDEATNKFLS